jgi:transcriptional regulator with XRE-family HTH domain
MESTAFILGEPQDVAAGVREFRTKHNLSQSELAAMSNVSLRTIQYLEGQGTQPTSYTVMRLDAFMRKYGGAQKKGGA